MPKPRVLVGFSGGIDSCAAVYFLQQEGYDIIGVTLIFHGDETETGDLRRRVQALAEDLGISLIIEDRCDFFEGKIILPFIDTYLSGKTPNPCIWCNEQIKLKTLGELADQYGIQYFATGHYAGKEFDAEAQRWLITKAKDRRKDQSYFLSLVSQEHLERLLLPLADKRKTDIRLLMKDLGISILQEEESHEICFLNGKSYRDFLCSRPGISLPGEGMFIDKNGTVLGRHAGYYNFTIGQRKGIGIADTTPYYVTALFPDTNQVEIGKQQELYKNSFRIKACQWYLPPVKKTFLIDCQIRYRHAPAPAHLSLEDSRTGLVTFSESQPAIAPGQVAAFYEGKRLIGAGIIETVSA
jgi:tRNA-specific 2-thiouridylase